jgi:hypothetical protein
MAFRRMGSTSGRNFLMVFAEMPVFLERALMDEAVVIPFKSRLSRFMEISFHNGNS